MKKNTLISILLCSLLLSGCHRGHDAPVMDIPKNGEVSFGEKSAEHSAVSHAQPVKSPELSVFMPSKTFMETIQGTGRLYLKNSGIEWESISSDDNINSASAVMMRSQSVSTGYTDYTMRYYPDCGFTIDEFRIFTDTSEQEKYKYGSTDIYVSVEPGGNLESVCAADVLTYALERIRLEKLVPIDNAIYIWIEYTYDSDKNLRVDADIYDGMGCRPIIRNELLYTDNTPLYDSSARSLYFSPNIPEYAKDGGTYLSHMYPDPSDFDTVLPYVYSQNRSDRYDLAAIAEKMPQITAMYIPKGVNVSISALEKFPLDTLYIDISGMDEDSLTALSGLSLDKLVMYGADSGLSMFSDCTIPYIGVYTDTYISSVAATASKIPGLQELGIIAADNNDMDFDADGLKKLSVLYTGMDADFLGRFTQLESLDISAVSISDADAIANLPLTSLSINCPEVKDYSFISGMTTLKSLSVRGGCPDVSALPLESLKVIYTDAETDKLFLPTLKELYISSDRRFDLEGIQVCTDLRSLTLIDSLKGYRNDISPLSGMDIPDLTLDIYIDDTDDTGIKGNITAEDAHEYDLSGITENDYIFTLVEQGTDEYPDEYSFINTSGGMMPYFPAVLERDGKLEGYTYIVVKYPSGQSEHTAIEKGRLLMETTEYNMPGQESDTSAAATYLFDGDEAAVYLFRE